MRAPPLLMLCTVCGIAEAASGPPFSLPKQSCGGDTCCCKGDPTGQACCGAGFACSMGGLGSCACQRAGSPPCVADFGAKLGDRRKCGTGIVTDLNQTCNRVNKNCNCEAHDPCNAPAGTGSCLAAIDTSAPLVASKFHVEVYSNSVMRGSPRCIMTVSNGFNQPIVDLCPHLHQEDLYKLSTEEISLRITGTLTSPSTGWFGFDVITNPGALLRSPLSPPCCPWFLTVHPF